MLLRLLFRHHYSLKLATWLYGLTLAALSSAAASHSSGFRGHAGGGSKACRNTKILTDVRVPTIPGKTAMTWRRGERAMFRTIPSGFQSWLCSVSCCADERGEPGPPVGSPFPTPVCCCPPPWSAMLPGSALPSPSGGGDTPAASPSPTTEADPPAQAKKKGNH